MYREPTGEPVNLGPLFFRADKRMYGKSRSRGRTDLERVELA